MDAYMPLWIKEDIWKWLREVMKKFDVLPTVAVSSDVYKRLQMSVDVDRVDIVRVRKCSM